MATLVVKKIVVPLGNFCKEIWEISRYSRKYCSTPRCPGTLVENHCCNRMRRLTRFTRLIIRKGFSCCKASNCFRNKLVLLWFDRERKRQLKSSQTKPKCSFLCLMDRKREKLFVFNNFRILCSPLLGITIESGLALSPRITLLLNMENQLDELITAKRIIWMFMWTPKEPPTAYT